MPPLRKIVLAMALVATIVASLIELPTPDAVQPAKASLASAESVALASAPTPAPAAVPTTALHPPLAAEEEPSLRGRFESQAANPFVRHSWQPPPPPPPKAEAPRAPPLPFRYLGKVLEEGEIMAFLGQGERTHLLRKGDILADYQVEEITPAEMTLVYLPLKEKQRLTFGSAK